MKNQNEHTEKDFFLSQWIADEITTADFKKLVSEEDYISYSKLKNGIDLFSALEKPLDTSFVNILTRIENKPKVRSLNYKWIASIAAMLIFFIGFNSLLSSDSVLNNSGFGEQKTIALLDGSEVILNAKSAINYSKKDWKKNREVYLTGEAFFKVQKGEKFTVKTKNGDITVLGTQFTVNTRNHFFEVVCYEGSVEVVKNGKSTVLKPTETFRTIKGKVTKINKFTIKTPTWIAGESTYRSVPLQYVISDLKNQFNLYIDDTNINTTRIFTGSFSHKNKDLALQSVFNAMGITYKLDKKKILVLENN